MARVKIPPLIASSHLQTVVAPLRDIGAPLERLMEISGLPVSALEAGDTMVSELAFWRLQDLVAARESMPDFGYRCAIQEPMRETGKLGGLQLPPPTPLGHFLINFIKLVSSYSNHANHSIIKVRGGIWYTCDNRLITKNLSWQVEQYLIGMITKLVRLAAGEAWLPEHLWVTRKAGAFPLPDDWSNTRISYAQKVTGVFISTKFLNEPVQYNPLLVQSECLGKHTSREQLIAFLMPLVLSGHENLEYAAESVNLTPRSLQRRLLREGFKYRDLVNIARFRNAAILLKNDYYEMQDVAALLGYAHAADFTRFFKRMSGVAPSEFANQVRN